MSTKPPRTFEIDVIVEHGQLHEHLRSEADRQLMIDRLDEVLSDTTAANKEVRDGVIQLPVDQLRNDNGHEPIFVRTGLDDRDVEERVIWKCEHADIEVEIDKYRRTDRTPHKDKPGNPFKFDNGKKGKEVHSTGHKEKHDSKDQKFYKFTIKGKDRLGHDLILDPCIICDR